MKELSSIPEKILKLKTYYQDFLFTNLYITAL